ncbi:MAG: hypothetical protein ACK5LY_07440 [Lachnospirales bacterium]
MKIFKFTFFLLLFFLTSCTSYTTNHREYVETVFIDLEDDMIVLQLYTVPLEDYGKNDEEGESNLLTTKGTSIIEAIKLLDNKLEKTLDFNHTNTLILGENFFKNKGNMKELLESFYEYNEISRKGNLYTTTENFEDIKNLLKKKLTLKKLTFPTTIADCLYTLNNNKYFILNNIALEGNELIGEKGAFFENYDFKFLTKKEYNLGYYLLMGSEQEELVLDSNFVVKDYSIKDKINYDEKTIFYDFYIKTQGTYGTKEYSTEATKSYILNTVTTSFLYYNDLSSYFFNIENELYKRNYTLYEKYINNKEDYNILPRFFIDVTD